MSTYFIYVVRCRDGSLYTGWTTNVRKRITQHNAGQGAKYTRSRVPIKLVYSEAYASKVEAMRREREIKKLSRSDKLRMVRRLLTA